MASKTIEGMVDLFVDNIEDDLCEITENLSETEFNEFRRLLLDRIELKLLHME